VQAAGELRCHPSESVVRPREHATFRFPLRGGTGSIWRAAYAGLPAEHFRFDSRVESLDLPGHRLHLVGGEMVEYDALISTMPLDLLLASVKDRPDLGALSQKFVHSSSHIVGIGLEGEPPEALSTKCWMYFPESNSPFYRVTVFSNYSPNNVARPGKQWSLMAEVSESPDKPVDSTQIVEDVVTGLRASQLIADDDRIVSRWHRRLEHGYPTPWLGRDDALAEADGILTDHDVYSRGRFGAWKYEVSNQDHSVMQGVEAVDHVLLDKPERTSHGDMSDPEDD
jgi:protoporphyrinogen oxidase